MSGGHRLLRIFVVLAFLGALGVTALVGSLWLEHRTPITPSAPPPWHLGSDRILWSS